jgi:hypothetical protein
MHNETLEEGTATGGKEAGSPRTTRKKVAHHTQLLLRNPKKDHCY